MAPSPKPFSWKQLQVGGERRSGRQRKSWNYNFEGWIRYHSTLVHVAKDRELCRSPITYTSSETPLPPKTRAANEELDDDDCQLAIMIVNIANKTK